MFFTVDFCCNKLKTDLTGPKQTRFRLNKPNITYIGNEGASGLVAICLASLLWVVCLLKIKVKHLSSHIAYLMILRSVVVLTSWKLSVQPPSVFSAFSSSCRDACPDGCSYLLCFQHMPTELIRAMNRVCCFKQQMN